MDSPRGHARPGRPRPRDRPRSRDRTLIAHAIEWIAATLDERGLDYLDGHDGHDRGKRGGDGKVVVNIFARVLDGDLGAEAVLAALGADRAGPTRASIGYREADAEVWTVRYERRASALPRPVVHRRLSRRISPPGHGSQRSCTITRSVRHAQLAIERADTLGAPRDVTAAVGTAGSSGSTVHRTAPV